MHTFYFKKKKTLHGEKEIAVSGSAHYLVKDDIAVFSDCKVKDYEVKGKKTFPEFGLTEKDIAVIEQKTLDSLNEDYLLCVNLGFEEKEKKTLPQA